MRSMFRTVFVAMLAVLALSAVAASAAQAEEAPFFKVAGARLAKGESQEVKGTAKAAHRIGIRIEWGQIICSAAFASGAKLFGSNVGEPGTGEMTLNFSECEILLNTSGCKVEVKSLEPLRATLVDLEHSKNSPLAVTFSDVKGSKPFIEIKGSEACLPGNFVERLEGSMAAKVLSGGKPVEVGKEPAETKTIEFSFPETSIKHVWHVRGGVGSEEKVEISSFYPAEVGGGAFTLELAGEPLWGVFA